MSPVYISCKILKGIFDDECYVMVNGSAAYYINNRLIRTAPGVVLTSDTPVIGEVQGYAIESQGGKTLVQLPGEVVVGGVRTWVENQAVIAA